MTKPADHVPRAVTLYRGDPITPEDLGEIRFTARRDGCSWCGETANTLIVVGLFHSMSGPGWDISACQPCVHKHDLLPLDDHPVGAWFTPMHRDGTPATIPPAGPCST